MLEGIDESEVSWLALSRVYVAEKSEVFPCLSEIPVSRSAAPKLKVSTTPLAVGRVSVVRFELTSYPNAIVSLSQSCTEVSRPALS